MRVRFHLFIELAEQKFLTGLPLVLAKIILNYFRGIGKSYSQSTGISDTLGKKVRVITSEGIFEGVAEICEDGAIIVGGKKIYAGDCIHLR